MISVLIPAYNEAVRIADTIRAVRRIAELEIVVVDDGSTDETAQAADAAGADIVIRQQNSGKGAALAAALAAAHGEILMLLDADLGATASEAAKLLAPIQAGTADMTIATLPVRPGRGGGMGMVVGVARRGIRALTRRSMAAPLSGQRALTRKVIEDCGGFAQGWGVEIALTVQAIWAGFRVVEVCTEMDHRVTGRSLSGVIHRAGQFRAALCVLVGLALSRRKRLAERTAGTWER